ncbi:MAG: 3',5'-cyclic-nucleotide phosphodiesterase [Hydrogenophilales bacterium CG03_land_8_20_14_0_80_62_28]|nr:3',5'-cyclic-nucleotide phosphodiesterase [Betaproteobacteria bacterium]OIO77754.1 MAG: 3',5'-cyclic-nucleotide phosphodiesterase [Hydrogenophilaceae bacterium CG1_02_62_390]PIV24733.1 MAG: 3',5'-cyclic-nucleotide phosphodiesterase [Hydrogenophilales bacterium CG03_land_8_20_14_0_80_62_28]PIW38493.1 MAG: 3',5'-cyclic-nucleotide phosphodiesterase [Hydrogenophilales bacterium CG15_BIG_FIL_POST_REV_8_21_14_020_62_31]PIW71244.1 MAG: 3',5'-cyclic-nucleotide phosphodiesterase [Hydrogenophilales ba
MKVRVLGCSGGIGGGRQTTSFLLDDAFLIDAGSGVTRLTLEEMRRIRHVFITHSHLDHILALPLLMDSVGTGAPPLIVHAIPEVIAALRQHLFNWALWPDFEKVPTAEQPFLHFAELAIGETVDLDGGEITAIPAHHGRPAVGYLLRGESASLLFSGDTASHDGLWQTANGCADLRYLLVECSFCNARRAVAGAAYHYCPETLLPDLARLKPGVEVWISHLKPGGEAAIMTELTAKHLPCGPLRALEQDQNFVV